MEMTILTRNKKHFCFYLKFCLQECQKHGFKITFFFKNYILYAFRHCFPFPDYKVFKKLECIFTYTLLAAPLMVTDHCLPPLVGYNCYWLNYRLASPTFGSAPRHKLIAAIFTNTAPPRFDVLWPIISRSSGCQGHPITQGRIQVNDLWREFHIIGEKK